VLTERLIGEAATAPSAPSHKSKKAQQAANAAANKAAADAAAAEAAAQADVITITIPSLPDKEIALGPVRHRLCEPLLKGKQAGGETVWEGIGRAVESASLSVLEKMAIWEGIGVVGELARVKCGSLDAELRTFC
jgi:actin-related protein 9